MNLEFFDKDESPTGRINDIGFDYQAEEWVRQTAQDDPEKDIHIWVLSDDKGKSCKWQRVDDHEELPQIVERSERFLGKWETGSQEVRI